MANSPEEALAAVRRKARRLWLGMVVTFDEDSTVAELASVWMDEVRDSDRQQSTVEAYESIVRNVVVPAIGAFRLADLNAGVCDGMLKLVRRTRSPGYARSVRRVMSVMLRFAVQHEAIRANFIRDVDPIKSNGTHYLDLEFDQIVGMLNLMRQWRGANPARQGGGVPDVRLLEDLILLMLGTSLRPGEVLALRRQDVVFHGERLKVRVEGTVSTTRKFGTIRKDQPKHERQKRLINVPLFASDVLRRRLATYVENPENLIFPTREGTVRQTHNLNRLLRGFREAYRAELTQMGIEVDFLTSRLFRKAAATTVFRSIDADAARMLLGHAKIETTLEHYIKPDDEVPLVVADALDARYPFGRR